VDVFDTKNTAVNKVKAYKLAESEGFMVHKTVLKMCLRKFLITSYETLKNLFFLRFSGKIFNINFFKERFVKTREVGKRVTKNLRCFANTHPGLLSEKVKVFND